MIVDGLSKENNELIGFVNSCLYNSAISVTELQQWALLIIDSHQPDAIPLYMFDLMDFNDDLYKLDKVIGFVSDWDHTKADDLALGGIAIARGFELYDQPAPTPVLLKKLQERPQIFERFKETFPFIDVSEVEKKISSSS